MTNNRGYIYVLANSAMPDLVKVGKTTRTPAERAAELSKVTGVPTPFIVVYEQLVDDCTAAEEFVHTMLQQKGYRESDNREFFRASPNEVIRVVMQIPNQISNDSKFKATENNENISEKIYPWLDLWNTAEDYFHGRNLCVKNDKEALKVYKKAVKLGCLPAYIRVGDIYYEKRSGAYRQRSHVDDAFEWYKQGAEKGNYYGYLRMATIFRERNDFDNVHECHRLFFKYQKENPNTISEEFCNWNFKVYCIEYFHYCFNQDKKYLGYGKFDIPLLLDPTHQIVGGMLMIKNDLISSVSEKLENSRKKLEEKLVENKESDYVVPDDSEYFDKERKELLKHEDALKWIEENL